MTPAEWDVASAGAPALAATFRQLAETAVDDAVAVIQRVKLAYSGTLPPPPWPASDALVAALQRGRDTRTAFAAIESRYPLTPLTQKARLALRRSGMPLYAEAEKLARQHAADMAARPKSTVELATRLGRAAVATRLGGLAFLGALVVLGWKTRAAR